MDSVDRAARLGPPVHTTPLPGRVIATAESPFQTPGGNNLVTLSEYKTQRVLDYSLTIEYKHLQLRAPGGVYVVPSMDNMRVWNGVIFIRQGLYRDGIFKFRMDIPQNYPADNARPTVTFFTPVFHPLVDPDTGVLDLDCRFPKWRYGKDYLVYVLVFIKKIFYTKAFPLKDFPYPKNPEALKLFNASDEKKAYLAKVAECVKSSLDNATRSNEPGSGLIFSEPQEEHQKFFDSLVSGNRRKNKQ
eukprot:g2748.t1